MSKSVANRGPACSCRQVAATALERRAVVEVRRPEGPAFDPFDDQCAGIRGGRRAPFGATPAAAARGRSRSRRRGRWSARDDCGRRQPHHHQRGRRRPSPGSCDWSDRQATRWKQRASRPFRARARPPRASDAPSSASSMQDRGPSIRSRSRSAASACEPVTALPNFHVLAGASTAVSTDGELRTAARSDFDVGGMLGKLWPKV